MDRAYDLRENVSYREKLFLEFNESIGASARLGMARAYVLQGDTTKARAKYQDFLTVWKNADPDIPILKEGKAEHARLQ